MKLKTSVAAVIVAFSATGAWAGPTGAGQSKSDLGGPESSAVQPSAGAVNEDLQWKFVNGTGASDSEKSGIDRAAGTQVQSDGAQAVKAEAQDGNDQSAVNNARDESDQAAASEQQSEDQSAEAQEQDGAERAAASDEQPGSDTAKSEAGDDAEQSAMTEDDEGSEQAATAEDDSGDQTAKSEDEGDDDQTARSEDQDESDQSASSDNPAADLTDKVVVIIPKDWKGSLSGLISALESSPDAKDIVIVQQGDPQASNDEPDDEYEASSMKPAINQQ